LLAVWNRAKGKERDALLWGDEVCVMRFCVCAEAEAEWIQVEYLVVNYADDDQKVTLSLRQADILHALAEDEKLCADGGCVPDLQDVEKNKLVPLSPHSALLMIVVAPLCPSSIPNLGVLCWRLPLASHGE